MTNEANIEDVEQDENNEVAFDDEVEEFSDWLEAKAEELEADVEDMEPLPKAEDAELGELSRSPEGWETPDVGDIEELPTAEEAELGELSKTPEGGQFEGCQLLGEETDHLIEAVTEGDDR